MMSELTLLQSSKRNVVLSKSFALLGGEIIGQTGVGAKGLGQGFARRTSWRDVGEVGELISNVKPSQALALGSMRRDLVPGDEALITGKGHEDIDTDKRPIISRTKKFFEWLNEPTLALLDFDRKAMPADVHERLNSVGGFEAALVDMFPPLARCGRILRASTSSGVVNATTGEVFPGGGYHLYISVERGDLVDPLLKLLHQLAWVRGFGWHRLSESGGALERSIIDTTVGLPERIVFEGAPELGPGLILADEVRVPDVRDGGPLTEGEIRSAQTAETVRTAKRLIAQSRDRIKGTDEAVKRVAVTAAKVNQGFDQNSAEAVHRMRAVLGDDDDGFPKLFPEHVITFDNGDTACVRDILLAPQEFDEATCADPWAPGEANKAIFFADSGLLFSFKHGGVNYKPIWTTPDLVKWANESSDPIQRLFDHRACYPITMRTKAIALLAKLRGESKSELTKLWAQLDRTKRHEEASAAIQELRSDARMLQVEFPPQFHVEDIDLQVSKVDALLSQIFNRTNDGNWTAQLCRNSQRDIQVMIRSQDDGRVSLMPAESEHVSELISRDIRLWTQRITPEGIPEQLNLRPPAQMIRLLMKRLKPSTPVVNRIARLPFVDGDGNLVCHNGLLNDVWFDLGVDDVAFLEGVENDDPGDAYKLLRDVWLDGVLAATSEDFAKLITLVLTIIQQHVTLDGRPAFVLTAHSGSRVGKSFIFRLLVALLFGRNEGVKSRPWPKNEEERAKAVPLWFINNPHFVVVDEVGNNRAFDSEVLRQCCTLSELEPRLLGMSKTYHVQPLAPLIFAGNDITPTGDMASRTMVVNFALPGGGGRDYSRGEKIIETVIARRFELLRAMYAILLAPGAQHIADDGITRFGRWDKLVARPVTHAFKCVHGVAPSSGVVGADMENEANTEREEMAPIYDEFFDALCGVVGDKRFTIRRLYDNLDDNGAFNLERDPLVGRTPHGRLVKALNDTRDHPPKREFTFTRFSSWMRAAFKRQSTSGLSVKVVDRHESKTNIYQIQRGDASALW